MSIYLHPLGDKLTDPACFTDAIKEYLMAEEKLLLQLTTRYDTIIEACCTKGRYAHLYIDKRYIGIDIAEHHITEAEEKHAGATFICDDIANLESIVAQLQPVANSVVVFPFNAFGNLPDPVSVLQLQALLKLPFIIFTYGINKQANDVRTAYYQRAGFSHLVISEEEEGVRFTNAKGLDSMAYSCEWFSNAFQRLGLKFSMVSFGWVGMAYMNFGQEE